MGLRCLVGDRREDEGRRRHKLPFVLLFWVVGIESSGWSLVHRLVCWTVFAHKQRFH
jgi:hypothetical protein